MASKHACPYCKGAISEQLAAFGGPCPHCLLEVPGDEAPTDPGLARQQQLDREAAARRDEDSRRSRRFAIISVAGFAAVIAFVIWTVFGGGYDTLAIAYYQQLDPAALQRKRAEQLAEAEAARQKELAEAQAKAAEAARRNAGMAGPRPGGGVGGNPLDGLDGILNGGGGGGSAGSLDALGAPVIAGSGTTSLGGGGLVGSTVVGGPAGVAVGTVGVAGSTGRTALTGTAVQMGSTQKPVESPKDAETMISERFYKFERQLQACWAPQIKLNPTLSGSWSVAFVVKPTGAVSNVRVKALSTPNAAFESCAVGKIQSWTFLPIAKDTPYDDVVSY